MTTDRHTPEVPQAGLIYRGAAWVGVGVMRLQKWRFDVKGLEHIPAEGGCLIAANHQSFWDFFAVASAPYAAYGRPVRILAKKSLFDLPVFGRLMYRTGCIPVDRGNGLQALHHAIDALRRGELVLILPEGTISRSFDLLTLRSGAARMALEAGVPLVPAATWGTHRFYTSGRRPRWSWRLPVTARYGTPLRPSSDADPAEVTKELQVAMQSVLDSAVDAYPDGSPSGAWWVPARLGGGAPDHAEVEAEWKRTRGSLRRRAGRLRRRPRRPADDD